MKFQFDTNYTAEEMEFIEKNNCKILSEIELSKIAFTEKPRSFHAFAMYSPTLQIMADSL